MSRTKEQFHEEINYVDDDLLQIITDEEWREYEEKVQRKYNSLGNGVYSRSKFAEFKKKNS